MVRRNKKRSVMKMALFATTLLFAPMVMVTPGSYSGMAEAAEPGQKPNDFAKNATRAPASERAAPEYGFGEKTDEEIMMERPRQTRIAVLGPMTGELKYFGEEASNGAELASDEINERGGIKNKQFELLVYDTKGTVQGTRGGVETLLKLETLAIVGAATNEVSFAATKLINDNELILISAGSRRRLGDTGPFNFRNTLADRDAVKYFIKFIKEKKRYKKFALFSHVLNDYSIQLNAIFKAELVNQGLAVTHELFLWGDSVTNTSAEDNSMAAQVAKLKKNPPDAVVFTGDGSEAAKLLSELKSQGIKTPIVGGEDIMVPQIIAMGDKAVGTLVYGGFDPRSTNPKVRRFVKSYKDRFGAEPSRVAALSYDAYYMLAAAIEKAPSLRPYHVRKALMEINGFDGVTGKTSMGPTGEAIKEPYIFELVKKGNGYVFTSVAGP